jgi:hypothetical protein
MGTILRNAFRPCTVDKFGFYPRNLYPSQPFRTFIEGLDGKSTVAYLWIAPGVLEAACIRTGDLDRNVCGADVRSLWDGLVAPVGVSFTHHEAQFIVGTGVLKCRTSHSIPPGLLYTENKIELRK